MLSYKLICKNAIIIVKIWQVLHLKKISVCIFETVYWILRYFDSTDILFITFIFIFWIELDLDNNSEHFISLLIALNEFKCIKHLEKCLGMVSVKTCLLPCWFSPSTFSCFGGGQTEAEFTKNKICPSQCDWRNNENKLTVFVGE